MEIAAFNIDHNKILKLLSNDRMGLKDLYNRLIERSFYIGETEVERRTLIHWTKEGLLPFNYNNDGWRKFSLVEYVWLRFISELRKLSLPLEKIKRVKEFFFNVDIMEYKDLFIEALENFAESSIENKEQIIAVFKTQHIPDNIWLEAIEEMQVSLLTMLILEVLINGHNLCLIIDSDDNIGIVVLGLAIEERTTKSEASTKLLLDTSFVLVNLRKIVQGFFGNPKIKYTNDYILSFLKPKEKKIIEKIQKGGIKEITIKFDRNSQPTHIEITDNKMTDAIVGKVARLLKKGDYGKIILQTQDGKLINYERKDIIKL